MSGLGTSQQTQNQSGNTNTTGQTSPWAPAIPGLEAGLNNASTVTQMGTSAPTNPNNIWYNGPNSANAVAKGLPNPALGMASVGKQTVDSGGDPYGILGQIQKSMGNINDPASSPGMQGLLNTIKTDTMNSINPMFAGAGRSLSGMNQQTLARGLAQGEAAPLQGQYNQDIQNLMNIGSQKFANTQTGLQDLTSAFPASQLPAQTQQADINAPILNKAQLSGLGENLTIPIAGMGGNTSGTGNFIGMGTGTKTDSPLSMIASLLGGGGAGGGGIFGSALGLGRTLL